MNSFLRVAGRQGTARPQPAPTQARRPTTYPTMEVVIFKVSCNNEIRRITIEQSTLHDIPCLNELSKVIFERFGLSESETVEMFSDLDNGSITIKSEQDLQRLIEKHQDAARSQMESERSSIGIKLRILRNFDFQSDRFVTAATNPNPFDLSTSAKNSEWYDCVKASDGQGPLNPKVVDERRLLQNVSQTDDRSSDTDSRSEWSQISDVKDSNDRESTEITSVLAIGSCASPEHYDSEEFDESVENPALQGPADRINSLSGPEWSVARRSLRENTPPSITSSHAAPLAEPAQAASDRSSAAQKDWTRARPCWIFGAIVLLGMAAVLLARRSPPVHLFVCSSDLRWRAIRGNGSPSRNGQEPAYARGVCVCVRARAWGKARARALLFLFLFQGGGGRG